MGFDVDGFISTQFEARVENVNVPDLKQWFEGDAAWKVRGLTGIEIAKAREAAEKNKTIKAVIEGISSGSSKKKAEAIKEIIGVTDNVPQDIAYRTEILIRGSIDPGNIDYQIANKLCENYPIEYFQITNKIIELSGKGHIPGKVTPSGMTKKSKQQ